MDGFDRLALMRTQGLTVGSQVRLMPTWNTRKGQQVPKGGVLCRVMQVHPLVPSVRVVVADEELVKMGQALPVVWPGLTLMGTSLPFFSHPRHLRLL